MGISPRSTFSRFYCATLDSSSFHWLFNWLGTVRVDIFAWLGCINVDSCLRRECLAKTCASLQVTNSLGRLVLCVCMASDLGCCLGDGNTFTRIHYPCSIWRVNQRFASLSDIGFACRTKYLGSPR